MEWCGWQIGVVHEGDMGEEGIASSKVQLDQHEHTDKYQGLCLQRTNRAFFKHVSTSGGNVEDTCGCVAVAEASQFKGCGETCSIFVEQYCILEL